MLLMYNTGRGVEIGFDSANTSFIDFHSYDSLNVVMMVELYVVANMLMKITEG